MKTQPQLGVHIRWMIRRDMPEVLAIEQASFQQPWSEDDFLRWFRNSNVIAMVAEIDYVIVGYVVYELRKTCLAIVNLAVSPAMRGQGVGRAMVEKLVGKLDTQRRHRIEAWINEGNLPAHLFFKACGFWATTTEREMFSGGQDGYLFERYAV